MIVTFRVIFLTYFVVTLPYICFVSISVDGTYWSAIVFNKDQLTHPACVQFMGENQQIVLCNTYTIAIAVLCNKKSNNYLAIKE